MSEIWYEVHHYRNEISPVEVVKETPAFVSIVRNDWNNKPMKPRRETKAGSFFKDRAEAVLAITDRLTREKERMWLNYTRAEQELAKWQEGAQ